MRLLGRRDGARPAAPASADGSAPRGARPASASSRNAVDAVDDVVVVELAGGRDRRRWPAGSGRRRTPAISSRVDRLDRVGVAEHLAPERVVGEQRLASSVCTLSSGVSSDMSELLEDHLALGVDLVRSRAPGADSTSHSSSSPKSSVAGRAAACSTRCARAT